MPDTKYQNTSMHGTHSTQTSNSEPPIERRRPTNNPSKNLTQNEIQCLYSLLGSNSVTLATAVVQLLHSYDNKWTKYACGVLCFIKDYDKRNYSFRLYDLELKQLTFEETLHFSIRLEKRTDCFYVFDGMNFKIGLSFADSTEAETFCDVFHVKQEHRQSKMTSKQSEKTSFENPVKTPATSIIQKIKLSPNVVDFSKKKVKKHLNVNKSPPSISSPTDLVHIIHVGSDDSFVADEAHMKLFEAVLSNMPLSKEEKSYIKNSVANTKEGLQRLFTTPNHYYEVGSCLAAQSKSENSLPENSQTTSNNSKWFPHQELSLPSLIYPKTTPSQISIASSISDQSVPPRIPPRPSAATRMKLLSPNHASPPMSTIRENQSESLKIPSAPPLPPSIKNDPSAPPINDQRDALLRAIRENHEEKQNSPQEPKVMKPLPKNQPKGEIKRTLEENIMYMINKRRSKIMGHGSNSDDDSDDQDFD